MGNRRGRDWLCICLPVLMALIISACGGNLSEEDMSTMTTSEQVRVQLEEAVPLIEILNVVVNENAIPPIIQVVFVMPGNNNVDVTLTIMQNIVCGLKANHREGYRYRIAAEMRGGITGIVVAIEPDVVEQIDCSAGAINWENATSEFSIASGLR